MRLGGADALEFRRKLREEQVEPAQGEGQQPGPAQDEDKAALLEKGEAAAGAEEDSAPAPEPTLPPPPRILEPLTTSLTSLNAELLAAVAPSAPSTTSPHAGGLTNPSNLVQPQGMLMRSLVTLNEYLESETYSASTFHTYRPYGAYGAPGSSTATGERKALQEVTHNFKADIRSLKGASSSPLSPSYRARARTDLIVDLLAGALLNRRNFVRPEVPTAA